MAHKNDEEGWIDAFVRAHGSTRRDVADVEALTRELGAAVDRARASRPTLEVDAHRFVAHLARHLPDGTDPIAALSRMHTDDMWLVCGCLEGNTAAESTFERECIAAIDPMLAHMQLDVTMVDEVKQAVRAKLLVSTDGAVPRIGDYAGRGDLRSWVGVIAMREALTSLRHRGRHPAAGGEDRLMSMESPALGPELAFLKQHYRDAFEVAFKAALTDLSPRARNALRHHYVHRLTIDQLAAMYGVHRSNAARRIANAREALMTGTRRRLAEALNVERDEFESIMRLIQSRLDLSVRRLLEEGAEPDPR
jgi:RNA polymerase sigma-70 factor (ECF subfamily)